MCFQPSKVGRNGGFANLPMVGRARRTAETAGTDTKQNLGKTPSHAKVYKVGGHGVVSCVSLSSSFPARPSPVAFLVRPPCAFSDRPPAPTLCSSRSPPPTVGRAASLVFKSVSRCIRTTERQPPPSPLEGPLDHLKKAEEGLQPL